MKWCQEIIVEHKEINGNWYHCFNDENYKKISNEREEQLKEIERLNKELEFEKLKNKEVRDFAKGIVDSGEDFDGFGLKVLEILDKEGK